MNWVLRWGVYAGIALIPPYCSGQTAAGPAVDVHVHIELSQAASGKGSAHVAVVWLDPTDKVSSAFAAPPGHYVLLQKNRMFSPHLLVVPMGSIVSFPNADPFFHNVFSYFNGKRFDLGLYEAGTSKEVTFSREGVSYIFCNIHPEMSAVILALQTRFYGAADTESRVTVKNVPPGNYLLHVWVEGLMQPALDRLTRRVQISANGPNSLTIDATNAPGESPGHLNKFGRPYDRQEERPY